MNEMVKMIVENQAKLLTSWVQELTEVRNLKDQLKQKLAQATHEVATITGLRVELEQKVHAAEATYSERVNFLSDQERKCALDRVKKQVKIVGTSYNNTDKPEDILHRALDDITRASGNNGAVINTCNSIANSYPEVWFLGAEYDLDKKAGTKTRPIAVKFKNMNLKIAATGLNKLYDHKECNIGIKRVWPRSMLKLVDRLMKEGKKKANGDKTVQWTVATEQEKPPTDDKFAEMPVYIVLKMRKGNEEFATVLKA